ncbi:hypothetical protein G210_2695 [Candida maltosa Xu316]|uniref:Uncharacterized protein n=1 Tax=Candida maltosa (strain Xu316) TaxID=1245528 RepID=M3HI70_CANMX|nr:hypothetical protein G210_2695 [Candida maltosa Xu316]
MYDIPLNTKTNKSTSTLSSQSPTIPPPAPVYHRTQSSPTIVKRPSDYYINKLSNTNLTSPSQQQLLLKRKSGDSDSIFSIASARSSTSTIPSTVSMTASSSQPPSTPKFERSFSVPSGMPMLNRSKTRFISVSESKQREKLRKQAFDEDDDELSGDECSLILFNVPLHNEFIRK